MKYIDELIQVVIKAAYKVHNTLGAGFWEKIYEQALLIELRNSGVEVEAQYPVNVFYEGEKLGEYFADLFVDDCLIVEIKAVENLTVGHEKQLVNYLAATKIDDGVLINFGSSVQIKRKFRVYKNTSQDISQN
ncbi:hypothetical protein FACS1894180_3310 [Bacteroidia bacterium]|nr:hypothetical protein FACS1894180_3310 [Bacteroidia bacterium]